MSKLFEFDEHIGDWRVLVQNRDIQNGAIQSRHIASGAVTGDKIDNNAIQIRHIAPGAVTGDKIDDNAIQSRHIAPGAVTPDKIAPGAIDDIRILFQDLVDNYKPIVINGDVTNAPDEEDITSADGLLKLKNRSAALSTMGYKILRRGTPLSEQMNLINTIYDIRYDFDLDGETLTIPENCVLKFEGGSLLNGSVICNDTKIVNQSDSFVFNNVDITGSLKNDHLVGDWFIGDRDNADTGINAAVLAAYLTGIYEVRLVKDIYCTYNPIMLFNKSRLIGLPGGVRTPSRGYYNNICSITYIFVRTNVDGIIVTPYLYDGSIDDQRQFSLNSVAIKNVFVNYNPTGSKSRVSSNDIKNSYGIHIYNIHGDYPITFRNSDFRCLGVNNFKYGIFIDNCGYYPSGSTKWRNVFCCNNHIGLVIKGRGIDNRVWSNCFRFNDCSFSNNYLGGVYFNDIPQSELVKFENCVFEGNGYNYNLSMIEDVEEHSLGINDEQLGAYALRYQNGGHYGQVIFENCYFEYNYFRKLLGSVYDNEKEQVYTGPDGSYVSPKNVMMNSYLVYSVNEHVVLTRNRINQQIKIAFIYNTAFECVDNFNTYRIPRPIDGNNNYDLFDKDPYLVYIDTKSSSNFWHKYIKIEEFFDCNITKTNTQFKYITSFVQTSGMKLFSFAEENSAYPVIDIKVPFENLIYFSPKRSEYDIYLNKIECPSTSPGIGTVFSPGHDTYDVVKILHEAVSESLVRKVIVDYVKGEVEEYGLNGTDSLRAMDINQGIDIVPHNFPDDFTNENNDVVLPVLRHYSGRDPYPIFGNTIISNFMISSQGPTLTPTLVVKKGAKIEFNNCEINTGKTSVPFITTDNNALIIIFNNCHFRATNHDDGENINITDNFNNTVIYNDCTVDPLYTLINYKKKGSVAERPTFNQGQYEGYQYYDIDLKKYILWDGTAWVNIDGSPLT